MSSSLNRNIVATSYSGSSKAAPEWLYNLIEIAISGVFYLAIIIEIVLVVKLIIAFIKKVDKKSIIKNCIWILVVGIILFFSWVLYDTAGPRT